MSDDRQRAFDLLAHLVSQPDATMADYRRLTDEVWANFVAPDDAQVVRVDAGGVSALDISAPGTDPANVVVFAHSGGFCMGSADGYREFGYRLSKAADCRVLAVDYRLAPENPFPAALDDVVAAYRWARSQPEVRHVALAGDSAGGGLVFSTLVSLRDNGGRQPVGAVAMSPLVDLAGEGESLQTRAHLDPLPAAALVTAMGGAYLGGRDAKSTPLASPLYADLHGLPPVLVFVGSDEGLHDDAVRIVAKVRDAGGQAELEVGEGMVHVYPVFDFLPEAIAATDRAGDFLRKQFAAAG
ncbi:MAG: alpha/beta hydrolase [Sporichthyaceae bacterium]